MKKIALLLLLSGCFNPKLQNGVPCAENDQCPEGQICADDKRCYDPDQVPEIDASVDGPDDVLRVVELAAALHTCARFSDGTLRCFGMNAAGQLGLGMGVDPVGDNEPPNSIPLVAINGVASVGAGSNNTCVALENGDLICWGNADQGELGQGDGNFELVGDDEDVSGLAAIDLGGAARKACSSSAHMTCALLESGQVRCFGTDLAGPDGSVIGIPGVNTIGLNDRPAQFPSIDFGTTLIADFDCGSSTAACAVNENGEVFCWGVGPLGYPGVAGVGENEEPVDAGPVDVGGTVAQVAVGNEHACARLTSGAVRCWGAGAQLGYGDGQDIGDNEPPADAGDVDINGVAVEIRANGNMTCVRLDSGDVRCWGFPNGHAAAPVGDNEPPSSFAPLPFPAPAVSIAVGMEHACAILENRDVYCWGEGQGGRLGYGDETDVGIGTSVVSRGPVPIL